MKIVSGMFVAAALMAGVSSQALAQSAAPEAQQVSASATPYYMADGSRTADYQAAVASWRADPQFTVDYSKGYLGLEHAYARGLSGRGVTVGVNDSGVYMDHPLFGGAGKISGLRTAVVAGFGNDGLINPRGMWRDHGTHVAGTIGGNRIAGERMFGNAYNATLVSSTINFAAGDFLWFRDAQLDGDTVITTDQNIVDLSRRGDVRIINNSWGSPNSIAYNASRATVMQTLGGGTGFGDRYQAALDNDVLVVFSAGNGSGVHAGVNAAAPLWTDALRSNWLSVANYQGNLTPSPSTSFCGQTASWCVAGPGHNIISTVLGYNFNTTAIRALYPRATYEDLYTPTTVATLQNAAVQRFLRVLNTYLGNKRAAEAAGLPFDENAARQEVANQAVAISMVTAARLNDPDGMVSNVAGLLTSSGNVAILTADFSRDVLERANAEMVRVLGQNIQFTGAGYGTKTGTSMAAPNVSGFAALLMEQFPEYNTALITDILVSSSRDLDTPGVDLKSGWGAPQMETALGGPTALRAVRDVTVGAGTVDIWSNNIGDARDRYSAEVLAAYGNDIGGIVKKGGGELILTGRNDYSGATRVEGGLLTVSGALLRSDATVADVGMIGGTGRLFNLTADKGGVVSPGDAANPLGMLTVAGNATFKPGSFLWIRSQRNSADNSQLKVEGKTMLEGGEVVLRADDGDWNIRSRMDIILSNGAVTGAFEGVRTNLAFLTPALTYGPNAVTLTLRRNDVTFNSIGRTPNEMAAGRGLDGIPAKLTDFGQAGKVGLSAQAAAGAAAPNPLYDALVDGSVGAVQGGLNSLSGEAHASLAAVAVNDSVHIRDAMLRRMPHALLAGPDAGAGVYQGKGLVAWGQAIAGFGQHDGSRNVASVKTETLGYVTGIDKNWNDKFQAGVAFGVLESDANVARPGSSLDNSRSAHVGAYLGAQAGPVRLRAGGAWGGYRTRTGRSAAVNAFSDSLSARYSGDVWQVFGEAGLGFEAAGAAFEPYVNLTSVNFESNRFTEQGGAAALSGVSKQKLTTSTLGLRSAAQLTGGPGKIGALGRVHIGWRHDLDNDGANATLAFAGGPAFVVAGAMPGKDVALVDLGLDLALTPRVDFGFNYGGQYSGRYQSHSVKATASWRF